MKTWFIFSPESVTTGQPVGEIDAMTSHEAAVIWVQRQHGDDSRAIASNMLGERGKYLAMAPDSYSWKVVGQTFYVYEA